MPPLMSDGFVAFRRAMPFLFVLLIGALVQPGAAHVNIDGGRSQLPGMRKDMFDQAQQRKGQSQTRVGKGPPDCPKSDKMSPFYSFAFVGDDMYVRHNGSTGPCTRLLTIGGANYSVLKNASRTCGPSGEWKKRIAEELSAVFFQAGLDWVKAENDTIELVTADGAFDVPVTESRFEEMSQCWARGCDCEQAKNPIGRAVLFTLLAIAIGGILWDSGKLSLDTIRGKKPPKHLLCRKGHRIGEVKHSRTHLCDMCGARGTNYACSKTCPYDLCKACQKEAKKKVKTDLDAWYAKNPEEKVKDEEKKKDEKGREKGRKRRR